MDELAAVSVAVADAVVALMATAQMGAAAAAWMEAP